MRPRRAKFRRVCPRHRPRRPSWRRSALPLDDLTATFGSGYPRGGEFLRRLEDLQRQASSSGTRDDRRIRERLDSLQREALLANPLLLRQPILYVWRNQYKQGGHHAIDTLFHTCEINTNRFEGPGALKTVDLATGRVTTLVNVPHGIARDPELHFDGKRIVFSIRRTIDEDYHIWEVNVDGTGLRQLTSAANVSDFDPLYLPDDSIAFSSTREPKYNQCSRDIGANLFRMGSDGANIHQIGKNNLFDNHGTLTPDGRILYARWEYVDRNFGDAHGIWTVNPDGTNQAIFWGNNTASPGAVYYPRLVPGADQMLCVFGMHHNRLWGSASPRRSPFGARRSRAGPTHVAGGRDPAGPRGRRVQLRRFRRRLSEVRMPLAVERQILPLLAHDDATWPGVDRGRCPPRPRDGDLLARRVRQRGVGACRHAGLLRSHADESRARVRRSSRLVAISRTARACSSWPTSIAARTCRASSEGSVKWLRVVESPEKRHWSHGSWNGQGYTAPGMNWHSLENKQVLGTVPVEDDGSAHFAVPSDKFVYFQLLDRDGMMIQSMRSGAAVQSGERITCVGCHDERRTAPPTWASSPVAFRRCAEPAARLAWPGAQLRLRGRGSARLRQALRRLPRLRQASRREAQPRCRSDHDVQHFLRRAVAQTLHQVRGRRSGRKFSKPTPGGSHASRLTRELRNPKIREHGQLKLSPEELDRVITWVDLNGVYYPDYTSAYPDSLTGRCPLNPAQLKTPRRADGVAIHKHAQSCERHRAAAQFRATLNSARAWPGFPTRAIRGIAKRSTSYARASSRLRIDPRCDMPGFKPCETDQRREAKFAMRREIELRNREAVRNGQKVYDTAK